MSDNKGESPFWRKNEKYLTGGAKGSLHGYDYQLKLLMLFAWEAGIAWKGKNCGIDFRLASEKIDNEWDKFDDLVFRYVDDRKINYRFLQAKHCYSGDKKIKIKDLLSESDSNDYSLQKYFKSYLMYDQKYKDGDLKDLIICSNAVFDFETIQDKNKQRWKGFFEEKLETDPILNLGGKIYQFKKSKKEEIIIELKPIFIRALEQSKGAKVEFLEYLSKVGGAKNRLLLNDCLDKIGDFLNKLVFAVEQPSGVNLEKKIAKKIGDEFNLINKSTYYHFYNFMYNWMQHYVKDGKNMEAHYLTHNDLKNFFNEAKGEIASLGLVSSNLLYKGKIEESGIKFKDEIKEFHEMENFLNNNETQILIIYHSKVLLSGIKVCQVLENNYKSDEYIFSDFKSLSILKSSVVDPFTAFENTTRNLLITEYNCKDKKNMLKPFIKVLGDNPKKKIILIISKEQKNRIEELFDDCLEELCIYKKTKYSEFEDKSNKFTDLCDESQKSLLEKKGVVLFQGKEVTLSSLIENTKYLISGEILCRLINNDKIEIGKEIEDRKYKEINECCIDRKFYRTVKISQVIEKETSKFFIINDNEEPVLNPEDNRDILLISDNVDLFMKLCNEHINKNIHLLRKEGNEFVWQQSRGDLSHLRTFIDSHNATLFEPDSINDKEVIIVSEPGMGKSTVLTHIALHKKYSDPSLLLLKIKLVDYSSELKKLMTFNKNEALIKFLYKIFLKKDSETLLNSIMITIKDHKIFCIKDNESKIDDVSWLEVQLFNEFYNNGKVIFFFDGFDEICPDYKVEIIELLKILKHSRSRIWITTRPYDIYEELENELGVFSYYLERFSEDEQQRYLKKFWSVDDERSNIFVTGLLENFSESTEDVERNFMSIPLQINMLAVVFEEKFKEWYDSGAELFSISVEYMQVLNNLNYLYEKFIYVKFYEIRIKEKKPLINTDEPDVKEMMNFIYEECLKNHRKLAAYLLLDESDVKLFLSELELKDVSKKIEDIKLGKEKTGIISHVADNKPVFVHRTFAEYFLSHFIYDKLNTDSDADNKVLEFLLKQILVEDKYRVIRRFLNCLFTDYKVDNIKSDIIKKLLREWNTNVRLPNFIDPSVMNIPLFSAILLPLTPLHVASLEGLIVIVKILLENQPDKLENFLDECFEKNVLSWDIVPVLGACLKKEKMEEKFINFRCGRNKQTALEYAVEFKHEDIVRTLLENGACITKASLLISISSEYFSEQVFNVLLDYIKNDELKESFISSTVGHLSLLHSAVLRGCCSAFNILIDRVDDINIQDKDGWTLLHTAVELRKDKFISTLMNKNADVNIQNNEGNTPLHIAAKCSYEITDEFLKLSKVNIKNNDGNTVLHLVAMNSIKNIFDLLDKGFNLVDSHNKISPIISKMLDICDHVRSILLERGINFYLLKNYGNTEYKWARTIELLLAYGADDNLQNNNGKRPIDLVGDFNDAAKYWNL